MIFHESLRVFKIVIASPGDVAAERKAAERIINEVSRHYATSQGVILSTWRWEVDSYPGFHAKGPQGLIDELMEIEKADLVVGIFWKRFGTPTTDSASGAEHELIKAWNACRINGQPQVMVYFNQAKASPTTPEEVKQWGAVLEFKERFPREGMWWNYTGTQEFKKYFQNHLQNYLKSRLTKSPPKIPISCHFDAPRAHRPIQRASIELELATSIQNHPLVAVGGLSGSGKTYLVANYLDKCLATKQYNEIFWHDPAQDETVDNLLAGLGSCIQLPGQSTISRCKALSSLLQSINGVLVIDNYQITDQSSYGILIDVINRSTTPCRLIVLSQIFVRSPTSGFSPHHIHLSGLNLEEASILLKSQQAPALPEPLLRDLLRKTGGLPFAISLFALLVVEFGYDPADLLAGAMENATRIKGWFDRILSSMDEQARRLLSFLATLEVPFNIGVVRAIGRGASLTNVEQAFEALQRRFLISKYTPYRWKVHELISILSKPLVSSSELSHIHSLLGHHFLRGLPRERYKILPKDSFLLKVRAYRHLRQSKKCRKLANAVLEELSTTAKAHGYYSLFIELSREIVHKDPKTYLWLSYHHAHCALILGQEVYCLRLIEPLLNEPKVLSNFIVNISLNRLCSEALVSSNITRAIEILMKAISTAPKEAIGTLPYAHARSTLASFHTRIGSYAEAEKLAWELLGEAERKNDKRRGAVAWATLGVAKMRAGKIQEAIDPLNRAKALFTISQDQRGIAWALTNTAECNLLCGELMLAETNLRQAIAITSDIGACSLDLVESLNRIMNLSKSRALAGIIQAELDRVKIQRSMKISTLN